MRFTDKIFRFPRSEFLKIYIDFKVNAVCPSVIETEAVGKYLEIMSQSKEQRMIHFLHIICSIYRDSVTG